MSASQPESEPLVAQEDASSSDSAPSPLSMPRRRNPLPRIEGFVVTQHALFRMVQMELTADRIARIITDPDDTWNQEGTYGADRVCYAKGNFGIVTSQRPHETPRIITVVWRSRKVWERRVRMGHER